MTWEKQLTDLLYKADGILMLNTPNSISSRSFLVELEIVRTLNLNSEVEKLLLPVFYGINEIPSVYRGADYQDCIESITKTVYGFLERGNESLFANQAQVKGHHTLYIRKQVRSAIPI